MGLFDGLLDFGGDLLDGANDFLGGALGGFLGDTATSAASGFMSMQGIKEMNKANAHQAKLNRLFQQRMMTKGNRFTERMSNTSYQRAMGDMKKAGLNPMLAFSQGGASTPSSGGVSGAQAAMQDEVTPAINTGMTARRLQAEVENIQSQTDRTNAETEVSKSQEAINKVMLPKIAADTQQSVSSASKMQAETKLVDTTVNKVLGEIRNLKSTDAQIKAATAKILEETKSLPLGRLQVQQMLQQAATQIQLGQYELPGARNEAHAQESYFKQEISPYLKDFLSITNSAGDVANKASQVSSRRSSRRK